MNTIDLTGACRVRGLHPAGTRLKRVVGLLLIAMTMPALVDAADCTMTSIGLTPINDLGTGTYLGFQGGLYPGGAKLRPAGHEAAGLSLARSIGPMNANGDPDPNGQYVLLSIGMSNANQEFNVFVSDANADPGKDPALVIVNGAQGGAKASDWASPTSPVWSELMTTLSQQSVNANQVAVVWTKLANSASNRTTDEYRQRLQTNSEDVFKVAQSKFPNLKLAYLASRIYAGYATSSLNPEPFAYEFGFVMKWVIEKQLSGDPSLNFDAANGLVNAPWLSWGPYLWADGLMPRSDGLIWACSDLRADDGTHPSDAGKQKVASILLDFVNTDSTAKEWFLTASHAPADTVPPAAPTNLIVGP